VNKLARNGYKVSLKEPAAIYIKGLEIPEGSYLTPDGTNPNTFWRIIRGNKDHAVRCEFRVPPGLGYVVGDIKINGRKIEYGGQLADFIKVKLTGIAITKDPKVVSVNFCAGESDSSLTSHFVKPPKQPVVKPPKPVDPKKKTNYSCSIPPHIQMEHNISSKFMQKIPEDHYRLIVQNSNKWKPGTELSWSFIESPANEGDEGIIVDAFNNWSKFCNIKFKRLDFGDKSAMIRIGFDQNDGSWSLLGTDILRRDFVGEKTMNFGWALVSQPVTAAHEIGHTLGFPHEHQNPNAGIVWNKKAVYDRMLLTKGWDKATVDHNIINKLTGVTGSNWDSTSLMHYGFEPGLIKEPAIYNKTGIPFPEDFSKHDIEFALKFYPFDIIIEKPPVTELSVGQDQLFKITLKKGENTILHLKENLNSEFNVAILLPKSGFVLTTLKQGKKIITTGSSSRPLKGIIDKAGLKTGWVVELDCVYPEQITATVVVY